MVNELALMKGTAALAPNMKVRLSFEALEPGIDFSSPAMKIWDGIVFQYKAILPTLKTCCLV